jgi:hypothetical protein
MLFQLRSGHSGFDLILDLQGMLLGLGGLLNMLGVLKPVAGALLDGEFQAAIAHATKQLDRVNAWAKHKAAGKAPQTLLVPAQREPDAWPWELGQVEKIKDAGIVVVDKAAQVVKKAASIMGYSGEPSQS